MHTYTQHFVCNYKNYCMIYVIYVAHLSIYVSDCSIILSYSSQALIHTLVYHTGFGSLSLYRYISAWAGALLDLVISLTTLPPVERIVQIVLS